MRISDWSSDVCSSDLDPERERTDVHHLYARHVDEPGHAHARADEAADAARHRQAQGRRTAGDADRLYRAHGAAARSALRHAAGGRQPGAGDLRPALHPPGDPGHDVRPWRGGGQIGRAAWRERVLPDVSIPWGPE